MPDRLSLIPSSSSTIRIGGFWHFASSFQAISLIGSSIVKIVFLGLLSLLPIYPQCSITILFAITSPSLSCPFCREIRKKYFVFIIFLHSRAVVCNVHKNPVCRLIHMHFKFYITTITHRLECIVKILIITRLNCSPSISTGGISPGSKTFILNPL